MSRLNQLPLLRLLLPFILGIVFTSSVFVKLEYLLTLFCILFISLATFISLKKVNSNFSHRWVFGIHIYLLFFLLGSIFTQLKTTQAQSVFSNLNQQLVIGEITEPPVIKDKIVKCVLQIKGTKNNEQWKSIEGKTIVFIEKGEVAENLIMGNYISFQPDFKEIPEPKNPLEFDYKRYLSYHLIKQQAYLKTSNWTLLETPNQQSIFVYADVYRRKMISTLVTLGLTNNELGVASALILGYKNNIEAQLKSAYSNAGAMHVLAVSGLHVGIIFMLFNALLKFLDKMNYGHYVKGVLLILILWCYALITGLSPSVLRSATMFSFIVVGKAFQRNSNFFNTLSASALLMLLFNPLLIFDVGFQLSYAAVAGIVLMQPWFSGFYMPKTWLTNYVWGLITVSIAAQVATFPIGMYYFHQFPNYFLLSNLLVIPMALGILCLGILTLAFSLIPTISIYLGIGLKYLVFTLNLMVTKIDQLPFSVTNNIKFTLVHVLVVYGIISCIILLISSRKFRYLVLMSCLTLFLLVVIGLDNYKLLHQKKIIVYNIPKHSAINLIDGTDNLLVSDIIVSERKNKLLFHVQNNWIDKGVTSEKMLDLTQLKKEHLISNIWKIDNKNIYTKHNFFQFYDYKIAIIDNNHIPFAPSKKLSVDALIWTQNCTVSLNDIKKQFKFKKLIIDSSNSSYITDKLQKECILAKIDYWSIHQKGAFTIDI